MSKNNILINKNCYTFKEINFKKGILDNCADATYIIHLEGQEERLKSIYNQLNEYHPSKKVFILFNKGYKNCKKMLKEQSPKYDLVDAFYQIMYHSDLKKYNNILILEDDFTFNKKIKENEVCSDIARFIKSKDKENFIYMLGCIPWMQMPMLSKNNIVFLSTGTHGSIYSKKFRKHVLNTHQDNVIDWDIFTNFSYLNTTRYLYDEPLCYQLFYETDNFYSWLDFGGFKYIVMYLFKYFDLHNSPEPGFTYFYSYSKISFIILLLLVLFFIIYMILRTKSKK